MLFYFWFQRAQVNGVFPSALEEVYAVQGQSMKFHKLNYFLNSLLRFCYPYHKIVLVQVLPNFHHWIQNRGLFGGVPKVILIKNKIRRQNEGRKVVFTFVPKYLFYFVALLEQYFQHWKLFIIFLGFPDLQQFLRNYFLAQTFALQISFQCLYVNAVVDVVIMFNFEMVRLQIELVAVEVEWFFLRLRLADDAEVGVGETSLDALVLNFFLPFHLLL